MKAIDADVMKFIYVCNNSFILSSTLNFSVFLKEDKTKNNISFSPLLSESKPHGRNGRDKNNWKCKVKLRHLCNLFSFGFSIFKQTQNIIASVQAHFNAIFSSILPYQYQFILINSLEYLYLDVYRKNCYQNSYDYHPVLIMQLLSDFKWM